MMPVHPPMWLERRSPSAFVITPDRGMPIAVEPRGGQWSVATAGGREQWRLARIGGPEGEFRLSEAGGDRELGSGCSLRGAGQRRELRYFLLGDGRLFRLSSTGPAAAGYDLSGWEAPGAYLKARALDDGWQILPTPASGGIDDVLVLAVLMGAEILDAEDPLRCEGRYEQSR